MNSSLSILPVEGMSSKYCLFCFKWSLTEHEDLRDVEEATTTTHLTQFLLNCKRYLKIPEDVSEYASARGEQDKCSEVPCDMCSSQVTSFNELYYEMKCIELKLQMKIRGLLEVMKDAGKVVSRKKSIIRALGKEKFRELSKRRKVWIQYCSQKLRTCFPRVILGDVSKCKSANRDAQIDEELRQQTLSQWLISITVVALMLIDASIISEAADNHIDHLDVDSSIAGTPSKCSAFTKCEPFEDCDLEATEESSESDWDEEDKEEKFALKDVPTVVESQKTELEGEIADPVVGNCREQDDARNLNTQDKAINSEEPALRDSSNAKQVTVFVEFTPLTEQNQVNQHHQNIDDNERYDEHSNQISTTENMSQGDIVVMDQQNEAEMIEDDRSSTVTRISEGDELSNFKMEAVPESREDGLPTSEPTEVEIPSDMITSGKYNLRKRAAPVKTRFSDSEQEVTDQEEEYKQVSESSETPDSSESSDSDDSLEEAFSSALLPKRRKYVASNSRSKHTNKRKYEKRIVPVEVGFSCYLDGCNFKTRHKQIHEAHRKLHEFGSYKCNFCDERQASPMLLSIHESTQHAKGTVETNEYICARCPFTSPYVQIYTCHFATEHLSLSGLEKCTPKSCEICKITVMAPKRHHRLVHENPGDNVNQITCPEENCNGRFPSPHLLKKHRRDFHKINAEKVSLRCEPCNIELPSEKSLRSHTNTYHQKFPCPVKKCPKTFKFKPDSDLHAQLHGLFTCSKCKFVTGYAPTFIEHEVECQNQKSSEGFTCPDCTFESKYITGMMNHRLETHFGSTLKIFKCKACKEGFYRPAERLRHFRTHHKNVVCHQSLRCFKCFAYFADTKQLINHSNACSGTIPKYFAYLKRHETYLANLKSSNVLENLDNYCGMCSEQCTTSEEFETHSKLHGKWKCQFCATEKEFAPDLALHELEEHGGKRSNNGKTKRFKCSRCRWEFRAEHLYSVRFVRHFISEHLLLNADICVCKICQQGFLSSCELKRHHSSQHIGKSKEKCDKCPAYFRTMGQLLNHKRNVHLDCKLCGKEFETVSNAQNHMKLLHPEVDKILCDTPNCGMGFDSNDDLLWHKRRFCKGQATLRAQRKEMICPTCGKPCKGEGALKRHMNVHRSERPTEWKCAKCGKLFKSKAALQMHEEFHKPPEEWKYMCTQCPKKSVTQAKLNEHMRTHTKEKPFVCQVCGVKYAGRNNLLNHIQSKHKEVEIQKKKHFQRVTVSRKGKKLGGLNFSFTKEKDLEGESSSDSSD